MSLRDLAPDVATALVAGALTALKVPAPIVAFVAALAPRLLPVLADLLERHEAGEPLPAVVFSQGPDDMAIINEEIERARART